MGGLTRGEGGEKKGERLSVLVRVDVEVRVCGLGAEVANEGCGEGDNTPLLRWWGKKNKREGRRRGRTKVS